jgi:hypothetical protein
MSPGWRCRWLGAAQPGFQLPRHDVLSFDPAESFSATLER